ncbi:MAG TPA: hypothetical protein VK498_15475, partial [Ferruginibacter sp.]|nr:hypothetical protein [Ferruginibacter sp.]
MSINNSTLLACLSILFPAMLHAQTWKELNPPPNIFNNGIAAIANDSNGNVYAGGKFKNAQDKYMVVKWNGLKWEELGTGITS